MKRLQPIYLIAALAIALRLPGLSRSLWLDEGFSFASATTGLEDFDAQRPLYFWFLRLWMFFGRSELWMRLPSVIFGVAGVILLYRLTRRVATENVARVAAVLMAVSYTQIEHSREARMYTLAPLLLLASLWFLLTWVESGGWRALAGYVVFAIGSLLTFPFCALGIAAAGLTALVHVRRVRSRVALLGASALIVALWSPFLLLSLKSTGGTLWIQRPQFSAPLGLHGWALVGIGPSLVGLGANVTRLATLVTAAFAVLGAVSAPTGRKIGLGLYATIGLVFLISLTSRSLWVPRYFMPLFPALFVLVALGAARLGNVVLPLVGLALTISVATAIVGPTEDWRAAAAYVSRTRAPGDEVVVVCSGLENIRRGVWGYYYTGPTTYAEDEKPLLASHHSGTTWAVVRTISPLLYGRMPEVTGRLRERFDVTPVEFPVVTVLKLEQKETK